MSLTRFQEDYLKSIDTTLKDLRRLLERAEYRNEKFMSKIFEIPNQRDYPMDRPVVSIIDRPKEEKK